jgi:phosphomethylpyrimidine synthase
MEESTGFVKSQRFDVAAEQGITEEAAIQKGLKQKATEFAKSGSEIYAKA